MSDSNDLKLWQSWLAFVAKLRSVPLWLKITGIQILPVLFISLAVLGTLKGILDFLVLHSYQEILTAYYPRLVRDLGITIVITLAITGVFAYMLSLVLVRPIRQVLSAIQHVEMGDFTARVNVWSKDEIGQMLKAFNNMIEELRTTQSALIYRNWQLTSVNELAESVTVGLGIDKLIEFMLKRVVTIMEADFGAIYLYQQDVPVLQLKATQGFDSPALLSKLENTESGRSMNQKVLESGHALVIGDIQHNSSGDDYLFLAQEGFQSWVCSPLKVEGEVMGIYHLGRRTVRADIYDDIALLEVVGNVVGVSLSNAQLLRDLGQKESELRRALHRAVDVQEDERKRLARELHDEIGQALTSILIQLKTIQEEKELPMMMERINNLRQLTSQTIEELRRLAMDLRPAVLDNLGITAAIRWYARQCSDRDGVEIQFSDPDYFDRLPSHIELILYRIVQEGLNNAIRHGKARKIQLALETESNIIRLTINDDGKGFHLNEHYSGLGLVGIRERVELLHGHFSLDTSPGAGTRLSIEIPVPQEGVSV